MDLKNFNFKIWAVLFFTIPLLSFAQFNISGKITDKETMESLPGANVVLDNTTIATSTNSDGTYVIKKLKAGKYTIKVSYIGYKSIVKKIDLQSDLTLDFNIEYSAILNDEIIVQATRVDEKSASTYSTLNNKQISENNMGQDLPYILQITPSVVTTSDAGSGVGYTGIRIRGTDITRINVTMNGVPVNDAESHGVYFVDLPDLASSIDNIQIQRGVGTSTNGAAAFGASINIQTTKLNADPYAEINSAAGSFNTFKNTARFGSGLINGRWAFDGRLSTISSDGYIDRGWSDLKSFYISGGYFGEKSIFKAIVTSGKEKTYQAWNGVPSVRLTDDYEGMQLYEEHYLYTPEETEHMMQSDSRTYNLYTYENQTDNYNQDYYQLHFAHQFNKQLNLSSALFYTKGKGYYESYKPDESYTDYGFDDVIIGSDTISETNLVNQKWLDNDYYGLNLSMNYNHKKIKATIGGGWTTYKGDHYGYIIWAEHSSNSFINTPWYENTGDKSDFNIFGKINYQALDYLNLYVDLQYRVIDYQIEGIHDDLRDISQTHNFNFFNPKFGVFFTLNNHNGIYGSFAIANREPNRSVYRDADENQVINPERLFDYELGYKYNNNILNLEANYYYMKYNNQLVLTGQINNVGDPILVNVPNSHRQGIEIIAGFQLLKNLRWEVNGTFSENKIKDFISYTDNWDAWPMQETDTIGTTDISFSPAVIAGSNIVYEPFNNFKINFISRYVSRQYIDNTSNKERSLDPYFVNDLKFLYSIKTNFIKEIDLMLSLNNIFNEEYETNAWVYSYYTGGEEYKMDGYFPQAKFNFMAGISLKF